MRWEAIPLYGIAKQKQIVNCIERELLSVYLGKGVVPFSSQSAKRTNVTSTDLSKYQAVDYGDFVLNNQQAWRGSVGVSKYSGIVSPAYIVLDLSDAITTKYADYLFQSRTMVDQYVVCSKGVGTIQRNIYWDYLKRIVVSLPPRNEQDQIVRYLDWKVSQINKIINAKRRQIVLLKEQKQVMINKAVGYSESCRKCKLKNLAFFKSGKNLTSLEIEPIGKYPVYGGNGLRGYYPEFSHLGEHLLVGRQGALCGNVHYVNEKFWATEHAVTVKPYDNANIKWLYYLLIDMNLNQYSMAAAQPGLSVEYVVNLPAYFPPIDEQQSIATYLDEQCGRTEGVIGKLNDEIILFTEYRTRLISDVVTGKVDVRGVAVPEYEVMEEADER